VVRNETSISEPAPDWPPAQAVADALSTTLPAFESPAQPPAPDAKVLLARDVWEKQRVYLERIETDSPDDSGWYVGIADDTEVSDYDAVRVADFLARRPDLDAVLRLPVGYLVVLDGASLEAVFDLGGTLLWPAAARPGDQQ
jgi:hypothetical protein